MGATIGERLPNADTGPTNFTKPYADAGPADFVQARRRHAEDAKVIFIDIGAALQAAVLYSTPSLVFGFSPGQSLQVEIPAKDHCPGSAYTSEEDEEGHGR